MKEWKTKDLEKATYLHCMNVRLLRTEGVGREIVFVFENSEKNDIGSLLEKYMNKEDKLSARQLFDTYRMLKSCMKDVT